MTTSDTDKSIHRCPECRESGKQVYGETSCGLPPGSRLAGWYIFECESGHSWTYKFDTGPLVPPQPVG